MKHLALALTSVLALSVLAQPAAAAPDPVQPDPAQPDPAQPDSSTKQEQPAPEPLPEQAAGVIVKFKAGSAPAVGRAAASSLDSRDVRGTAVVGSTVRAYDATEVMPLAEAEAAAAELAERADVEWAEPNTIDRITAPWPNPVNDPLTGSLRNVWDTRTISDVAPWPAGGYGTKAPALWGATKGAGVRVAVLDTGILPNHPDLSGQIVSGYDMVSNPAAANDGNGRDSDPSDPGDWVTAGYCGAGSPADDSSWHGSHVAGTIAASDNNGIGIVGMAPDAKIQPIRVLGRCGGTRADIAAGIAWAAGARVDGLPANPNPAKVLNMSLGGSGTCDNTYRTAIAAARNRGASIFVAAGNSSEPVAYATPANCPGVITVASTSGYGDLASYSNYGAEVEVSGPGGDFAWGATEEGVLSTVDSGTRGPVGPAYSWSQGTSMATPAVAGSAALLASLGRFTPNQMSAAIKAATTPFPSSPRGGFMQCNTAQCGAGILDMTKVPAPVGAPSISGQPAVGATLTATDVPWTGPAVARKLTWYVAGSAVGTGATFTVPTSAAGQRVHVRTSVSSGPFAPIGSNSAKLTIGGSAQPKSSTISFTGPRRVKARTKPIYKVDVDVQGVAKPTGKVVFFDNGRRLGEIALKPTWRGDFRVRWVRMSKLGRHTLKATYQPGTSTVRSSSATLRVRVVRSASAPEADAGPRPVDLH